MKQLERKRLTGLLRVRDVKGSSWFEQSLGLSLPPLAEFSRRGYVIAVVQYRPSPVPPFPAQIQDAKSAVRFLHSGRRLPAPAPDRPGLSRR